MAEQHNFPDDEYHFTETESSDAFGTIEKTEKPQTQQNVKKRIFIAIGIIVLVLLAYKLWNIFVESKPTKPLVSTPIVAIPEPKPQVPVPTEKPESAFTAESARALSQIQQQETENARLITSLQSQIAELKTSLNGAVQKTTSLDSNIQSLRQDITNLKNTKVSTVKPKKRVVRIRRFKERMPIYYVNAIVPGRAWLKSNDGSTLTVSTGNVLKGYGKVTSIDVQNGRVRTSSGKEIRFSPADSY